MQLFHIATVTDWEAAQRSGFYITSTVGRTLQEEGFVHASRAEQWEGVRRRYYADIAEPLVLLVIDTDLLTSPWREDPVGDDTYPHIYGPLNPSAVVTAVPLAPQPVPSPVAAAAAAALTIPTAPERGEETFLQVFLLDVVRRIGAALAVLALAVTGGVLAGWIKDDLGFVGAIVGLASGALLVWLVHRSRRSR